MRRWGAAAAVAAACALLTASLAGSGLYASSVGSRIIQLELAETCPTESGLGMRLASSHLPSSVADVATAVPHSGPAITSRLLYTSYTSEAGVTRRLYLLHRDGQDTQTTPAITGLGIDDLAIQRSVLGRMQQKVGDTFTTRTIVPFYPGAPPGSGSGYKLIQVRVAAVVDDIPFEPVPRDWCGEAGLLEPTAQGDPPTPLAFVSAATMDHLDGPGVQTVWYLPVAGQDHLTLEQARATEAGFERVLAAYADALGENKVERLSHGSLDVLIERAASLTTAVKRTIAPVRLAGVLAALLVLASSAVMLARERRRMLRLHAVRGTSPWTTTWLLARSVVAATTIGCAVGLGLAALAVRLLGPAPQFEHAAIRAALVVTVVAALITPCVVGAVAALTGDRAVDPRARRHWARWIPFELVVLGATIAAFHRLQRVGGVRMIGDYSRGGDLVAQAFTLLAIVCGVVLVYRPIRWLARRARTAGTRLPRSARLGLRRCTAEPALTSVLVGGVALATGCALLAGILTHTTARELVDKSNTFIGSDVEVDTVSDAVFPTALAGRTTIVHQFNGRNGNRAVVVMGVDHATFAEAAIWRSDASTRSLPDLVTAIAPRAGDVPAIVVGADDVTGAWKIDSDNHSTHLSITPVAHTNFFPGFQSGTVMVVIDAGTYRSLRLPGTDQIWVRHPPAGLRAILVAAGNRVRDINLASNVFESISYSAQRWAYLTLGAFAVLVAITMLTMQLLLVEARRDSRRLTHVLMSRTGFTPWMLWRAAVVELAAPLATGVVLGAVFSRVAAGLAVGHLDPLPTLEPPPIIIVPTLTLLTLVAAAAGVVLVLATLSVRSTVVADPMEVTRGTA